MSHDARNRLATGTFGGSRCAVPPYEIFDVSAKGKRLQLRTPVEAHKAAHRIDVT